MLGILSALLVATTGVAGQTGTPDAIIRFETGSAQVGAPSKVILRQIVSVLREDRRATVIVVGHADRHGTEKANQKLSLDRAKVVSRALIALGVKSSRMQVKGAGSSKPFAVEGESQEELNRRVELWIRTTNPLAWVSWIQHKVEKQKPDTKSWDPARLKDPLRRRFRVRTQADAAGEVTFRNGHRLFLAASSLAVISDPQKGENHAAVKLEEGDLVVRPARRMLKPLGVQTDALGAQVDGGARIEHRKGPGQSTVAVHRGATKVTSQGKTVTVREGYGTVVKDGQAPETPHALPASPSRKTVGPILVPVGTPVPIAWASAKGAKRYVVELFEGSDDEKERPIESYRTTGLEKVIEGLKPGVYQVRVRGVDNDGLSGRANETIWVSVMSEPRNIDRAKVEKEGDHLVASVPSTFQLPKIPGGKIYWNPRPNGTGRVRVNTKPQKLTYRVRGLDGRDLGGGKLTLSAKPFKAALEEISKPQLVGGNSSVSMMLRFTSDDGQPLSDLDLIAAAGQGSARQGLEMRSAARTMTRAANMPSEWIPTPFVLVAPGLYRLNVSMQAGQKKDRIAVSIFERRTQLSTLVYVPVAVVLPP